MREAGRSERVEVGLHDVVRVAEIPGEAVEVGEHVAARARRLAVARREARIVEEAAARRRPAAARGCRAGAGDLLPRRGVDRPSPRCRSGSARTGAGWLRRAPGRRAAAAHLDVVRRIGHECVGLQLGRCRTCRPRSSRTRRRTACRRSPPPYPSGVARLASFTPAGIGVVR